MKDFPRELVDVQSSENHKLCPCCRKHKLPIGLFAHNPETTVPDALENILVDGYSGSNLPGNTIYACGRFFCKVDAALPLGRLDSPIRARIWAEIQKDDFEKIVSVEESSLMEAEITGCLATDIPGFPGSMGAQVFMEHNQFMFLPTIIYCADQRLQELEPDLNHQGMVELYRKVWGNNALVVEADMNMRAKVNKQLQELIEVPLYRKFIPPPPGFAGIRPAEVLVAPPLDTGEEAVLATVGCSDVTAENGEPVELITWVRNPSDDFIKTFADFGYLSRLNDEPIKKGLLVPENPGIPGSDDNMVGWLLWDLWKQPDASITLNGSKNKEVKILSAVPLYEMEVIFAHAFGVERLAELLFADGVDPADLTRANVIPSPEEGIIG